MLGRVWIGLGLLNEGNTPVIHCPPRGQSGTGINRSCRDSGPAGKAGSVTVLRRAGSLGPRSLFSYHEAVTEAKAQGET